MERVAPNGLSSEHQCAQSTTFTAMHNLNLARPTHCTSEIMLMLLTISFFRYVDYTASSANRFVLVALLVLN